MPHPWVQCNPVVLKAELTNIDYTGVLQMATRFPVKTLSDSATPWHFDYFFIARLIHCFDAQLIGEVVLSKTIAKDKFTHITEVR